MMVTGARKVTAPRSQRVSVLAKHPLLRLYHQSPAPPALVHQRQAGDAHQRVRMLIAEHSLHCPHHQHRQLLEFLSIGPGSSTSTSGCQCSSANMDAPRQAPASPSPSRYHQRLQFLSLHPPSTFIIYVPQACSQMGCRSCATLKKYRIHVRQKPSDPDSQVTDIPIIHCAEAGVASPWDIVAYMDKWMEYIRKYDRICSETSDRVVGCAAHAFDPLVGQGCIWHIAQGRGWGAVEEVRWATIVVITKRSLSSTFPFGCISGTRTLLDMSWPSLTCHGPH